MIYVPFILFISPTYNMFGNPMRLPKIKFGASNSCWLMLSTCLVTRLIRSETMFWCQNEVGAKAKKYHFSNCKNQFSLSLLFSLSFLPLNFLYPSLIQIAKSTTRWNLNFKWTFFQFFSNGGSHSTLHNKYQALQSISKCNLVKDTTQVISIYL